MNRKIYLDYNASTPIAPEAVEAMRPFLTKHYGNPSSNHWAGSPAKDAVEKARRQVASLLGCDPAEIVFTSGGSEANNHALKGVFFANRGKGNHIITSAVEHPAILNPCHFLEKFGAQTTVLPVDRFGRVDADEVRRSIRPNTILITVMHANNEVGTIQPIPEISAIAREAGIVFHTDAAQSIGKIPCAIDKLGVDLLSVAGHKLYAPKGIGALYIKKGTQIEPLMHGAGHEQGRRAGTENVLLAVALGTACSLAQRWTGMPKVQALRDRFWDNLQKIFGDSISLNGHPIERLPNTVNVNFIGRTGADILARLPEVAASTGAACHSGSVTLSPVLAAMGVPTKEGMGAIRFSLGRATTWEDLEIVLDLLYSTVSRVE
jgi:cysteine desulfurase